MFLKIIASGTDADFNNLELIFLYDFPELVDFAEWIIWQFGPATGCGFFANA